MFADTEHGWLYRDAGGSPERMTPLGDEVDPHVIDLALGPDSAVWALMRTASDSYLGRYDGSEWEIYSTADGLPAIGARFMAGLGDRMAVDQDGRVWFSIIAAEDVFPEGGGLAVFDGDSFTRYLMHAEVDDLAVAPDGSVWTSTDQGLYVITPEAVAEAE